ncbi:uncharacterized protein PSFLO_04016 [Pseudozyma flocculosa]|uniref:ASTRA-associated protein 1 n=1 Tax=Pseudozyma flocculosa TaxID=84751 RepID=A0A5C3F240_9BASI|nr:uncharacterized protein PSFLO_04016 [Pseudozyma flocculosa]
MPAPFWVLRHHSPHSIQHLFVDSHTQLLIAGDAIGRVSVTHLDHYRQHAFWSPHSDSILGVNLHGNLAITHGRDNRLALWRLANTHRGHRAAAAAGADAIAIPNHTAPHSISIPSRLVQSLPTPTLVCQLEVNALNFARFSLLLTNPPAHAATTIDDDDTHPPFQALIAVPHTLDAAWFDVFHLPTGNRIHQAVSKPDIAAKPGHRQPIIMSLRLLRPRRTPHGSLACLVGYEDGYVKLWSHDQPTGWTLAWQRRLHSESVMDISLTDDGEHGVSDADTQPLISETGKPGRAAVSVRNDDKVIAAAGWDGRIRLHSSATLQELGSLDYHRDTVETLAFFEHRGQQPGVDSDDDVEDDLGHHSGEDTQRRPLEISQTQSALAAGGRDGKISLWHVF